MRWALPLVNAELDPDGSDFLSLPVARRVDPDFKGPPAKLRLLKFERGGAFILAVGG